MLVDTAFESAFQRRINERLEAIQLRVGCRCMELKQRRLLLCVLGTTRSTACPHRQCPLQAAGVHREHFSRMRWVESGQFHAAGA